VQQLRNKAQIIALLKSQKHKPEVNPNDWDEVHLNLLVLGEFTVKYCVENRLPLLFTSIIRPKIKESLTDIHAKKRAFDISVKGWTENEINEFVGLINSTFHIGAISMRDGQEREAVYEDGISAGNGAHLHVQCRP
jgi:hypothetical protein